MRRLPLCVVATLQLLDEEQTVVTKKLVSGSTSSSTTEPATNCSSYTDTVECRPDEMFLH
jgi:hypothetical protein